MPTYEYRCKNCRHQFEAVQSFTDDALSECPACGGVLKKLFGSVGITFKGSGFYKTDSRAGACKSDGGEAGSEKPAEKVGAGKDGGGPHSSSNGSSGSGGKDSNNAGGDAARSTPVKDGGTRTNKAGASAGSKNTSKPGPGS